MDIDPYDRGIDSRLTNYADTEFSRYLRRAFLSSAGYDDQDLVRPIVGITNTVSDFNTCHRELPQFIESVRRGVLEAGGLPMVFPTISLGEILLAPTSMLFRNLMAMETEEMVRAQPMDAVVMVGGCDKTTPAQMMAAASLEIPSVISVAGPMMAGEWRGERLGACTDCRRYWSQFRAKEIDAGEISDVQNNLCPTAGTCMVMGTASTMSCLAETMGMMVPGGATPPAASGARLRIGVETGRLAVEQALNGKPASEILNRKAFENALIVLASLSGSTNAVVHLLAIAGRVGTHLDIDDFDRISREIPLLVDCKPAGSGYMEDFHRAGGVPALLKVLESKLNLDVTGVNGKSLGDFLIDVKLPGDWQTTIKNLENPLGPYGALVVLRGSLAPDGAVFKRSSASSHLHKHKGRAVVFEGPEDVARRIDDPSLGICPDDVLVMRGVGPVGMGMPEAGSIPIPSYLAKQGIQDMVRVSDGRMSGTAYGAVALHIAPEAAVGGPLAFVEDGDEIFIDAESGILDLNVSEDELVRRRKNWFSPQLPARGWRRLYARSVQQANLGADLDFLVSDVR
ncbi:MAG: dihydroxy-acid dehydratase [Candidatus Latescibacterota bacterium]|nr:dihydroxy-acid dehydratase [Candidatus Latescibacterota bacterium]